MDETLADLADDLEELRSLGLSSRHRIDTYTAHVEKSPDGYLRNTREYLLRKGRELRAEYDALLLPIGEALDARQRWVCGDVARLVMLKKTSADMLRTMQGSAGAFLVAGDWQSPSFDATCTPQAGIDEGHIRPGDNDYRRDAHSVERRYGREFCAAYIDHPLRIPPLTNITNSGMAAVTAALTLLAGDMAADDTVLAGRSSYFQNRWVLEKLFPKRITYVDEFDTEGILRTAREQKPKIVFLDTLCNAPEIPVLDVRAVVPALAKVLPRTSSLVLDNTGLATSYQPLAGLPFNPLGMRLIVIESLLKYHQFGMDRVTAGVVWSPFDVAREEDPFFARMHGGTIAPDFSVHMLPVPNRRLLDTRLARLNRNARILANAIDTAAREGGRAVSHATYPGLPSYRGYAYTKDMPFQGGFLTLAFHEAYASISHYDRFVARALATAKKRGLNLVGGTSFGFNTTRISVPARYTGGTAKPFVRIAAGTETKSEIEELARMFADVVRA